MNTQSSIRESVQSDLAAIEALYPEAFPDEDLLPLVRDLLNESAPVVSLVATINSDVAGHVAFTYCSISGQDSGAALLGPLAVSPPLQGQGIGSALVYAGLQRMQVARVDLVLVLGDPEYYKRFGFMPDSSVEPPYPLPREWQDAWQSLGAPGQTSPVSGKLVLPELWRDPALWGP